MNNLKNKFSIKDLENLTGIKAHTIRIWEKRYKLLSPKRTDTNIRYYDLASFQKLLNVSYLNNNGYKISKIATLKQEDIQNLVREIASKTNLESHAINSFKLAMLNFDQVLFYNTYDSLLKDMSFEDIFYEIFIPLLTEIGLLWQTNTITPAHEHFLTTLIRQKILINTEFIQAEAEPNSKKTFVLYLPDNEIHELGLMFLYYQIVAHDYHAIFLGQSVPLESLEAVLHYYDDLIFLSYFTIKPHKDEIDKYVRDFDKLILQKSNAELWILGQMLNSLDLDNLPSKVKPHKSIEEIVSQLK
ncbi:MAG: MerR family transcriptional regulator [Winogradskyella sp.]|uniref:MerR family transcriptional regulator n=1 Tax=Winogradskyella sp. TaxID=1883156 RepID=UPI000F3E44CB|nr:MerR family transcriptional regulator [Winogradskyella sp.]RNC80162.1 MAG: MerR family transcriptional regulator [Winogradskyella sp.]